MSAATWVTSTGVAGVAIAVAIIVSGRGQHRQPVGFEPDERGSSSDDPVWRRLAEQVRQICAVLGAGFVGGFLGFGLGGRLMMRLLAVTSPDAQGRLTEADEIVGEVSGGGTMFLIFLLTFVGVVGALALHLLRPLLPSRTLAAGAVVGAIGGGVMIRPSELLNPENRDFAILEPTWLAVLLCVGVVAVGALATAVLVDRWVPRWPAPAFSVRGIAGLTPLVVCIAPPIAIATAVVVGARTVFAGRRAAQPARRVARGLVGLAGGLGAIWIAVSGVAILA